MGKTWAQTRYALGISHEISSCSPFPTSWSWCTVSTLSFKTHWVIIIQPRGDKFMDYWCHLSSQTLQGVRPKAQPWQMWAVCFPTEGQMMFPRAVKRNPSPHPAFGSAWIHSLQPPWMQFKPSAPLQELCSWSCSTVLWVSLVVPVENEDTVICRLLVTNPAAPSPSLPITLHN